MHRWLLALPLLFGCGPRAETTSAESPARVDGAAGVDVLAPADPDFVRVVASLGDGAPVLVVLRPARWRAADERVTAMLPQWTPHLLAGETVTDALALAAAQVGLPVAPGELDGLDRARPVLLALFEPPVDGPPLAVLSAADPLRDPLQPLRSQVWLPAEDPAVLLASIERKLALGVAYPELLRGREQAFARFVPAQWPNASVVVGFVDGDGVRVIVLHGGRHIEPARDAELLRARLAVDTVEPDDGPALRLAARETSGLSGFARPWRWRSLMHWQGLTDVRAAVDDAGGDQRGIAAMRGLNIAAATAAFMRDAEAEAGAWGFAVEPGTDALQIWSVAELTTSGRALADAAELSQPVTLSWRSTSEDLRVASHLDLERIAARLGEQPSRPDSLTPAERARFEGFCGLGCPLHDLARFPLSTAVQQLHAPTRAPARSQGLHARARVKYGDGVLASTLTLASGTDDPPEFTPSFAGVELTRSPTTDAATEGCLAELATHLVRYDAIAGLDGERWTAAAHEHALALVDRAACSTANTDARAIAELTLQTWTRALIRTQVERGQTSDAVTFASTMCSDSGDRAICTMRDELLAVPTFALHQARAPVRCSSDWEPVGVGPRPLLHLRVGSKGAALGARRLSVDARTIAAAIIDELGPEAALDDAPEPSYIGLAADPTLRFGDVIPAIEALAATGATRVALVFEHRYADREGPASPGAAFMHLSMTPSFTLAAALPPGYRAPDADDDEEPPPEPEAKLGKPSDKDGLYAMKKPGEAGPSWAIRDEAPIELRLDGRTLQITSTEGIDERSKLDALAQVFARLDELELGQHGQTWRGRELRLTITRTTPWAAVLELAVALCDRTATLVIE